MKDYQKAKCTGVTETVPVDSYFKDPTLSGGFVLLTDDYVVTAADNGKTFGIATDAKTITLPATIANFRISIINMGAAANNIVTLSPAAADGICGTVTLAAAIVTRVGTVDTDLVNTSATSTLGNSVSLIGTGITGTSAWVILSSTGIWA